MFPTVPASAPFPKLEEEVLAFWRERKIYEQSLQLRKDAGAPRFVFYEGPPTANGMPHPGHCLTRAIKDLFPRYRTMRGYLCERKAGWDTHGLPVEVEVCKEMGIHSKEEIEAFGVEPFIQKCQQSVWRYMKEWEKLTERIGFWVDLQDAYVTYHQSYVESVWWSLKNLFDRGLLYQGHKIVWWWAQGGTALSAGEVGQGYREVADPSVYVLFPLLGENGTPTDESLVVWTTTPWTLPSNQFAAVRPDLTYAVVRDGEHPGKLILANDLVETLAGKLKRELTIERTLLGSELVDRSYLPPFDTFFSSLTQRDAATGKAGTVAGTQRNPHFAKIGDLVNVSAVEWLVVAADFVTTDSGTGIVHIAPPFGEVDYEVFQQFARNFAEGERPELINAVGADGKFITERPDYCRNRWVKDCDREITRDLDSRGLLLHREQYVHDYPFCWRADNDPLIQYPRRSWFIKTTAFKDAMLANNQEIQWQPEHIRDGRFGNFLETNVDWALSRERYWGTPLPIWVCQQTGKMEAVSSYEEVLAKPGLTGTEVWAAAKKAKPELPEDLKVHKPYIDAITYDSPFAKGARMKRVTEVIDCWYDSGAMPFAQWGYRGEDGPTAAKEKFHEQFPADFISEAIDQTRGWFYSQLAISTMLFGREPMSARDILALPEGTKQEAMRAIAEGTKNPGSRGDSFNKLSKVSNQPFSATFPHPYKSCIVLGLMLGEDGQKMSKSKRNYREPNEIFVKYGADALRWYFFANQPPWTSIRYKEQAIKDSIPEFLLRLWNCFSFFTIYANIDSFDPAKLLSREGEAPAEPQNGKSTSQVMGRQEPPPPSQLTAADFATAKTYRPIAQRSELDRWVLSELNRTLAAVVERMDAYDNFEACKRINEFVDGLSNWYVRRSRDRFWATMDAEHSADKHDAYWTFYECLLTTAKMIAPFTPFLAETMWRNLAGVFGERAVASVHLCDYPIGNAAAVDELLSARMQLLREIASLGLSARMANKLKVRQPLAKVEVILSDTTHQAWLIEHDELLRDELNVRQIDYTLDATKYITYQVQPNFKRLGPRVGKLLPACKEALGKANGGDLLAQMTATGKVTLTLDSETIELDSEDIQVRLQAKEGWAAAQGRGCVVVLSTELTPELIRAGLARDLMRLIQDRRKELNLEYTDRIEIAVVTEAEEIKLAITENQAYICGETLATSVAFAPLAGEESMEHDLGDGKIKLYVGKV